MNRPVIHARGHAPNCACPRCRHLRWWHSRPGGFGWIVLIWAIAIAAGCTLNLAIPAERLLGTEPNAQELAR